VKWVVTMGFNQTATTPQKTPTKTIQALVDPMGNVAGKTMVVTQEVAEVVMTKWFIEVAFT
jgi:hypothetical protein